MRIVVVGGGVVGMCCAWALQKRHDVVVVDRDALGAGASSGNAGWVTSALSGPLPAPGVVRKGLRWMTRPDSPLLIRPRPDGDFARWLWHFARNCRAPAYERGLAATLALSRLTQDAYRDLVDDGIVIERQSTGLVCAAATPTGWQDCRAMRDELVDHGYAESVTAFEGERVQDLDPALQPGLHGAMHFTSDWHVDPQQLCASLAAGLAARGVDLRPRSDVRELRRGDGGWQVGLTSGEALTGDRVVVASGVWTPRLLRTAGARLLIEPAKGYSISGRTERPPAHAIYMHEAKVGCSPYDGRARLAGTLELAGLDPSIRPRRVAGLERAAQRYLVDWKLADARAWAGFRSATPDGLPYIGDVPGQTGLMVAAGHGTLGVTLAPATGVALARAVDDGGSPILEPFRLDRPLS